MSISGSELVIRALADEGIRLAFGIPGTHNIELYDALAASERVRPVLITDEQSAGFMADGAWRASGEMACLNLVPGAGLTHALSGIAEAFLDGVPMLVLGCGIRQDGGRAYQLHDVDQLAIARPITKAAVRSPSGPEIYRTIREACALARAGTPGPVMVEIPVDQYLFRHPAPPAFLPEPAAPPEPDSALVRQAAELLGDAGARPLLYLGLGAREGGPALVRLAEALGAPVATTISGKGVFPERHPLFLWNGYGRTAPPFARELAERATVTLAIGCRFSEVGTGSYSTEPRGPLVHVDVAPEAIGQNYPARIGIVADASLAIAALLGALGERRHPEWRAEVERAIATGRAGLDAERARREDSGRVAPERLFAEIAERFGPRTVYATDSGNGTFLAMEALRLEGPGRFLAPVDYSCMGYAVPAAIGAKLACPELPVVAAPGDGAFLMTGLELLTAASQSAPIATFVLRDHELAQIAQFQRTAFGRTVASRLPDYDVGSLAEAVGVEWVRLERDADLAEVVRYAWEVTAAGRPIVVDTAIDYEQPTYFTRGVVRANLERLPLKDRLRMVGRALGRRLRA
ncbi:MAG: thiamine pyrophosphate-binding protein [Gemmatimonadales bacterium]